MQPVDAISPLPALCIMCSDFFFSVFGRIGQLKRKTRRWDEQYNAIMTEF